MGIGLVQARHRRRTTSTHHATQWDPPMTIRPPLPPGIKVSTCPTCQRSRRSVPRDHGAFTRRRWCAVRPVHSALAASTAHPRGLTVTCGPWHRDLRDHRTGLCSTDHERSEHDKRLPKGGGYRSLMPLSAGSRVPLNARKTKLMRREANSLLRLTFAAGTLPPLPRLARLSVPYLSTRGDLPVHFGD
jgi:hypothetical protein